MRRAALILATLALGVLPRVRAEPSAEPAVLARYEVRRSGAAAEVLVVMRNGDRIEHRYEARHTVEVWRRIGSDDVERLALFPEAKRAVRYTGGDLRALGEPVDWPALSSLVGADERAQLTQVGTRKLRGELATRLRGMLRGRPATLTWLPAQALPAALTLGSGREAVTLKLLDATPCTPERCAPTEASDLKVIDFADLGDMTYDPFVQRFLRARGGGHAH
ncbi:MAG: hypothetical protein ABW252_00295 [Polyangiales bacterium]